MTISDDIHVATSRSGSKIFSFKLQDLEHQRQRLELMCFDDHFDAWAVFQRLAVLAIRKYGVDSEAYSSYLMQANLHRVFLTEEIIINMKKKLALKTSIDLMQFAAKLCDDILID